MGLLLTSCGCRPVEVSKTDSPSDGLRALLVVDGCGGATNGFYTDVVLEKGWWSTGLLGNRKNVLTLRGRHELQLQWIDARTLVVDGAGPLHREDIVRYQRSWSGITVKVAGQP